MTRQHENGIETSSGRIDPTRSPQTRSEGNDVSEQMLAAETAHVRSELAAQERREEARRMYRESLDAELPMTARALGAAFRRSERWGRERISEVRAELMPAVDPPTPGEDVPQPDSLATGEPAETVASGTSTVPDWLTRTPTGTHDTQWVAADRSPGMPTRSGGMPTGGRGMPYAPTRAGTGRAVSWLAFLFGIAATVAANVAHTFYPTAAQLAAWHAAGNAGTFRPEVGAVIGAAFWPLALLLAVEVLARVAWPAGGWWRLARHGGAGAVAGIAALMSYRHMAGLLTAWGEDPLNAHLGPLAVDGLMVLAGFALLSMGARHRSGGSDAAAA